MPGLVHAEFNSADTGEESDDRERHEVIVRSGTDETARPYQRIFNEIDESAPTEPRRLSRWPGTS